MKINVLQECEYRQLTKGLNNQNQFYGTLMKINKANKSDCKEITRVNQKT